MLIDCDACAVRGPACSDCVVSVLLAGPAVHASTHHHAGPAPGGDPGAGVPTPAELDAAEQAAIAVLAGCGLVPPLRLVPLERNPAGGAEAAGRAGRRRPGAVAEGEREVS